MREQDVLEQAMEYVGREGVDYLDEFMKEWGGIL